MKQLMRNTVVFDSVAIENLACTINLIIPQCVYKPNIKSMFSKQPPLITISMLDNLHTKSNIWWKMD